MLLPSNFVAMLTLFDKRPITTRLFKCNQKQNKWNSSWFFASIKFHHESVIMWNVKQNPIKLCTRSIIYKKPIGQEEFYSLKPFGLWERE